MNVLLIESSELLRERYTRILSSVTEVKTLTLALNSEKSIDIIKDNKPEAIIIAQELNSDTYKSIIIKIRAICSEVIIIILTSNPFSQMEKLGLKWGADYILDKSSGFEELPDLFKKFRTVNTF